MYVSTPNAVVNDKNDPIEIRGELLFTFTYLGSVITENGSCLEEIQRRKNLDPGVFNNSKKISPNRNLTRRRDLNV